MFRTSATGSWSPGPRRSSVKTPSALVARVPVGAFVVAPTTFVEF